VKFFFDNNLAPKLAHALNQMVEPEHRVIHLKDNFPANVEDAVWMRALAKEPGWVIVTADIRIGRNPYEVQAWRQSGHTIFFLKPGWVNLPFWEQANKLTKCFPALIKEAERAEPGSAFIVTVNGKIQRLS
jgi:predicted nuclease of predicted toxin-antitoxin system